MSLANDLKASQIRVVACFDDFTICLVVRLSTNANVYVLSPVTSNLLCAEMMWA